MGVFSHIWKLQLQVRISHEPWRPTWCATYRQKQLDEENPTRMVHTRTIINCYIVLANQRQDISRCYLGWHQWQPPIDISLFQSSTIHPFEKILLVAPLLKFLVTLCCLLLMFLRTSYLLSSNCINWCSLLWIGEESFPYKLVVEEMAFISICIGNLASFSYTK